MMQKDENLVLDPWVRYYAYLFGFENLTIFDNGSCLPEVISALGRYAKAGVQIITAFASFNDWVEKGNLLKLVIECWDKNDDYDFAIPLDCDEFLAVYTSSGMSCQREDIHAYFDKLIGVEHAFLVSASHYNVPGRPGWFWPTRGSKCFFAKNTIGTLDHGYHVGTSRKQDGHVSCDLAHLHYHHKPYHSLIEHTKRKLRQWVDVDNIEALSFYDGPGAHLIRHFSITEAEYKSQFDRDLLFGFTGLSNTLSGLGIDSPYFIVPDSPARGAPSDCVTIKLAGEGSPNERLFVFDSHRYLAHHIDVAAAGRPALEHFLLGGHSEGRQAFNVPPSNTPMSW